MTLGLRTRLALALAAVAIVPTAVLGVMAVRNASHDVEAEVASGRGALARGLGHDVEGRLEAARHVLEVTGAAWAREQRPGELDRAPARALAALADARAALPWVRRAALFDLAGVRIAGDDGLTPPPLALTYGGFIGDVVSEPAAARVPIVVQARGRTGAVVGLIAAELDLGFVQRVLDEARLGRGGTGFIVDGQGHVIARSVGALDPAELQRDPALARALTEPEEGHAVVRARGEERVTVYRTLWLFGGGTSRAVRWSVLLEQPTREAFALARRTARITFAIGAGVLVLAIAIALLVAGGLLRPLRRLTARVETLGQGGLMATRSSPGGAAAARGDEVSVLTARFDEMTERLGRAHAELEALAAFLTDLVESLPVGIVSVDGDGIIKSLNPAQERLSGVTAASVLGRRAAEAFPMRAGDLDVPAELARVAAGGAPLDLVKDDVRTPLLPAPVSRLRIRVAALAGGRGAVIMQEDLSERARLEAELLRSEKLASVGLMAAGFAHEINNPLTTILGYASLLLEDLPEDQVASRDALVLVHEEARRVQEIVRGLLDYARMEPGRIGATDLNAAVARTLALVGPQLKKRKLRLETELARELPTANADGRRLEQVFVNLAQNAAQAMSEGGVLTVTTRLGAGEIEIAFTDTGPGIAPEHLARIFNPFFTTKGPGVGTGLGLALSREIVVQHGGRIEFESVLGQGSTFHVFVPIAPIES